MLSRRALIVATMLAAAAGSHGVGQMLHQRGADAQPGASAAPGPVSLTETHWNLTELAGAAVAASGEGRPYIYLQAQGDKLSGSGGCNRLFSSYDLSGSSLEFHSVASTRMACPGDAMRYETQLGEALRLTNGFQISGNVLSLQVDERVLAKFEPEKPK